MKKYVLSLLCSVACNVGYCEINDFDEFIKSCQTSSITMSLLKYNDQEANKNINGLGYYESGYCSGFLYAVIDFIYLGPDGEKSFCISKDITNVEMIETILKNEKKIIGSERKIPLIAISKILKENYPCEK